jgi:hypothetical protein
MVNPMKGRLFFNFERLAREVDEGPRRQPTGRLTMSTDKKGTKILARTFFAQLRSGGYTPNQIVDIATELLDLVTNDLKEVKPVEGEQASSRLNA